MPHTCKNCKGNFRLARMVRCKNCHGNFDRKCAKELCNEAGEWAIRPTNQVEWCCTACQKPPETPEDVPSSWVYDRVFAAVYSRFPQLWKPGATETELQHAYASLGGALGVRAGERAVLQQRCRLFALQYRTSLRRLAYRHRTAEEILRHAPSWMRDVEKRLNWLPSVLESIWIPEDPEQVLHELAQRIRSSSGPSSSKRKTELILRSVANRLGCSVTALKDIWTQTVRVSLLRLQALSLVGDVAPAGAPALRPHEWLAADATLLQRDQRAEWLLGYLNSQVWLLHVLVRLVQQFRLEERAPPAARRARWASACRHYTGIGLVSSLVVLQRRWWELKRETRAALRARARGDHKRTLLAHHALVARRYPHVVSKPLPSWGELRRQNLIVDMTEEQVQEFKDLVQPLPVAADDLILKESKNFETPDVPKNPRTLKQEPDTNPKAQQVVEQLKRDVKELKKLDDMQNLSLGPLIQEYEADLSQIASENEKNNPIDDSLSILQENDPKISSTSIIYDSDSDGQDEDADKEKSDNVAKESDDDCEIVNWDVETCELSDDSDIVFKTEKSNVSILFTVSNKAEDINENKTEEHNAEMSVDATDVKLMMVPCVPLVRVDEPKQTTTQTNQDATVVCQDAAIDCQEDSIIKTIEGAIDKLDRVDEPTQTVTKINQDAKVACQVTTMACQDATVALQEDLINKTNEGAIEMLDRVDEPMQTGTKTHRDAKIACQEDSINKSIEGAMKKLDSVHEPMQTKTRRPQDVASACQDDSINKINESAIAKLDRVDEPMQTGTKTHQDATIACQDFTIASQEDSINKSIKGAMEKLDSVHEPMQTKTKRPHDVASACQDDSINKINESAIAKLDRVDEPMQTGTKTHQDATIACQDSNIPVQEDSINKTIDGASENLDTEKRIEGCERSPSARWIKPQDVIISMIDRSISDDAMELEQDLLAFEGPSNDEEECSMGLKQPLEKARLTRPHRWKGPLVGRVRDLMLLCTPVSVVLEKLPDEVLYNVRRRRVRLPDGAALRRVRLPDGAALRRPQPRRLVAQVAPLLHHDAETAASQRSTPSDDVHLRSSRSRTPSLEDYGLLAEISPSEDSDDEISAKEIERVLLNEKAPRAVRAGQLCCLARRHRAYNDAKRRIALRQGRGDTFVDVDLHGAKHGGGCGCCCRRLLRPAARSLGALTRRLARGLDALLKQRGETTSLDNVARDQLKRTLKMASSSSDDERLVIDDSQKEKSKKSRKKRQRKISVETNQSSDAKRHEANTRKNSRRSTKTNDDSDDERQKKADYTEWIKQKNSHRRFFQPPGTKENTILYLCKDKDKIITKKSSIAIVRPDLQDHTYANNPKDQTEAMEPKQTSKQETVATKVTRLPDAMINQKESASDTRNRVNSQGSAIRNTLKVTSTVTSIKDTNQNQYAALESPNIKSNPQEKTSSTAPTTKEHTNSKTTLNFTPMIIESAQNQSTLMNDKESKLDPPGKGVQLLEKTLLLPHYQQDPNSVQFPKAFVNPQLINPPVIMPQFFNNPILNNQTTNYFMIYQQPNPGPRIDQSALSMAIVPISITVQQPQLVPIAQTPQTYQVSVNKNNIFQENFRQKMVQNLTLLSGGEVTEEVENSENSEAKSFLNPNKSAPTSPKIFDELPEGAETSNAFESSASAASDSPQKPLAMPTITHVTSLADASVNLIEDDDDDDCVITSVVSVQKKKRTISGTPETVPHFVNCGSLSASAPEHISSYMSRERAPFAILRLDASLPLWALPGGELVLADTAVACRNIRYYIINSDSFNRPMPVHFDKPAVAAAPEPPAARIKVRSFAKMPADDADAVDAPKSEVNLEDMLTAENKLYKRLADDPPIYGRVLTAMTDVMSAQLLAANGFPLHVYSPRSDALLAVRVRRDARSLHCDSWQAAREIADTFNNSCVGLGEPRWRAVDSLD